MGQIKVVLIFNEDDERQREAGEYLKTKKRCKTALVTELVQAWLKNGETGAGTSTGAMNIDAIKKQLLQDKEFLAEIEKSMVGTSCREVEKSEPEDSDNLDMDDASDYVYEFILCSICPVKLDKPGLCYNVSHNTIENRVQDWVVGAPENGFLFPAFTDRNTDIHNLLYFTKNAEMDQPDFLDHFLGCQAPLSAKSQKETFQSIIEETLDSACDFSTVMTIQENLNTMIEERKDDPEPVVLDKHEVKRLLASSGVPNEQLDEFDEKYESIADEKASFVASNVASTRNYEIRTPDVIIKVSPEKAQLIETRTIDGTPYILIEAADEVEINGILLKPSRPSDADDTEF